MEQKNVILLTVISIATLLTAVVGASFAYFSTTVEKNVTGQANEASVTTAKYTASTITFSTTGDKIVMENAIPGDSKSTTFEIANSGNTDITYNVAWTGVTSTFGEKDADATDGTDVTNPQDNLKYSLVCVDADSRAEVINTNDVVAPTTATASIKAGQVIGAGKTHECTLTVKFINITDASQNYNQGRSFEGTIDVTTENIQK
ncbi:MAG: TasA family protein [Bacilli bacterium]